MTRQEEGFYFLLFISILCGRLRSIEIIYALYFFLFFLTFERGRKENIIRDNYAVKMNRHQIGTLSEFVSLKTCKGVKF